VPDENGQCVNCAQNPDAHPELCTPIVVLPKLAQDEVANIEEDEAIVEGQAIPEDALKPSPPERNLMCMRFLLSFDGIEKYQSLLSNSDNCRNLINFNMEGYTEGTDYSTNCVYNAMRKKLEFGCEFEKDTEPTPMTLGINDPSILRSDNFSPEEEVWDGTIETPDFAEEEQAVFGTSSAPANRRRVLQDATGTSANAPILVSKDTISQDIIGRRFPSEKALNFATKFGKAVRWVLFGLFVLSILMSFALATKKVEFPGVLMRTTLLYGFISQMPIIPANYGYLLSRFYDEIYKFHLMTMFKIVKEGEFRGPLEGKLDEYRLPVMVINSIPIQVVLFVLSSLVYTVLPKKNKKEPSYLKKISNNFHYIILSWTVLDVVFFGSLQVFNHNPTKSGNKILSWVSYVFAALGLVLAIVDVVRTLSVNYKKKGTIAIQSNFSEYGYLLRFFVSMLIMANLQAQQNLLYWLLLGVNVLYFAYMVMLLKTTRFKTKGASIRLIVTELLIFVVLVLVRVFIQDPDNTNYSSDTTEKIQIVTMVAIFLLILIQFISFVLGFMGALSEAAPSIEDEIQKGKGSKAAVSFEFNAKGSSTANPDRGMVYRIENKEEDPIKANDDNN
jgi:hypothetical protein